MKTPVLVIAPTLALVLTGCPLLGPKQVGPGMYDAECSWSLRGCLSQAQDTCPNGYDVVDSHERAGPMNATANTVGTTTFVNANQRTDYELVFRCK